MSVRLVVTADDYGLTEAVSRGILAAHRDGVVTATSVLAVGPAVHRTAGWLADHPRLAVGAHLALVGEDPPVLSAREVPTLVTRSGRFPLTYRGFLLRAAAGRVDPADVARELDAQMQLLTRDLRLAPGHVDTHQHLHLWPPVARAVVDVARTWGIRTLRLPTSHARGPLGTGVRLLARRLAARAGAAGLAGPAGHDGLDAAGHLTGPALAAALNRLAGCGGPVVELTCHPGEADPATAARYRWGFTWADELAALTDPALPAALAARGLRPGPWPGFSDPAAREESSPAEVRPHRAPRS